MKNYYLNIVKGKEKGVLPFLVRGLLYPISIFYGAILTVRNYLYDCNRLKSYKPENTLVISIGNLVVGGTGKTPAVQFFADLLYPRKPFAILTRGYRSKAENSKSPVVLTGPQCAGVKAAEVGDEPLLHALRYPQAHVIVNKNRIKSSVLAKECGAEVIILDDGMQHRKLSRDLEVVILDASDPLGQGHLFPRGLLRESPKSLNRADLILINHVKGASTFEKVKQQIAPFTTAPCIATRLVVSGLYDLQGKQLDTLAKRKAAVFCALGKPDSFHHTIKELGVDIVEFITLPDHDSVDEQFLISLEKKCREKGGDCLICSEKDAVKISKDINISLPLYRVQIKMEIIQELGDQDKFQELFRFILKNR